jgi:hypothetical protein
MPQPHEFPIAEGPDDFARACAAVFAGSVAAMLAAVQVCRLPAVRNLTLISLSLRCLEDLTLTLLAGAVCLGVAKLLLGSPPLRQRQLILHALAGWLFLPGIVLLARTWPAWVLPVAAAAAGGMAVSLRLLAPGEAEQEPLPAVAFASLYGMPWVGFRPARALAIAVCAEAALVLAVAERFALAALLLGAGAFLLLWHWSAEVCVRMGRRERRMSVQAAAALAWMICVLALLPWLAHHAGTIPLVAQAATAPVPAQPHFGSVILWPPKQRVTEIYFPAPDALRNAGRMAKPVEIPFDGAYWYFEPPDDDPGTHPHIAHGLPTDARINLSSAAGGPLRMDAVQRLRHPLAMKCCSAIDVAVTDADTGAGLIHLGVLLTDGSLQGKPSVLLGIQPVAGSETMGLGTSRLPLDQTVRFSWPASHVLRRFDQITVIILPSVDPARGAKLAVRGFTLLPR